MTEAIPDQFAGVPTGLGHPQIVGEDPQGRDWFHQSQGYLPFFHVCMAAPDEGRLRDLATRFADFYLNEADDTPDNYDFECSSCDHPAAVSIAGKRYRGFRKRSSLGHSYPDTVLVTNVPNAQQFPSKQ